MIRSELVARIAVQNPHLYAKDVEAVVDTILERIGTALADGGRVELRDFGSFSVRRRPPRSGRNPRTQAVVQVAEKANVLFKLGKAMHELLNLKAPEQCEAERLLQVP